MCYELIMFTKKELLNKSEYTVDQNGVTKTDIDALNNIVETFYIEYQTKGKNEVIDGYLCMPKVIKGKLPIIIYIRGGISTNGRWGNAEAANFLSWLSSLGFIVIMSNLRDKDEVGGSEIEDIYYLEKLLESIPEADTSKINIVGHSIGGINSFNILRESKFKNKIGKVVVIAGCSDTVDMMTRRPNLRVYWNQFFDTENENENYIRSSVKWIDKISSDLNNLYIIHGTDDSRVDFENFRSLKAEMEKNNKIPHLIPVIGADHNPNYFKSELEKIFLG
jgi:dipeptidyl aminopeptidase/acylaminoacyl peptidase